MVSLMKRKVYTMRLRLFRRKTFFTVKYLQMQMIYRKTFVFSVFVCILENSLKNILQYLEQSKMKINKKLETAIPPPQTTGNPPQTTINNPQTHHHSKTHSIKTKNKPKTNKSKPTNHHNHEQHRFLAHEHVGERDGSTSTSTLVLSNREHEHEHTGSGRVQIWGGFDRKALRSELESHCAAFNHELTDLINHLVESEFGAVERERELRKSRERE